MDSQKISAVASAYIEVLKKSSEALDQKQKTSSPLQAIETINSFEALKSSSYDLGEDPKQLIPLAKSNPEAAQDLKKAVRDLAKQHGYAGIYNSKCSNPNKIIKLDK